MTNSSHELEELRRQVQYFKKNAEKLTSRVLRVDLESMAIRRELEQKRKGFSLMASLAMSNEDPGHVLLSVSRRINAALGMQRTAVLTPAGNGEFKPLVLQGYNQEESENLIGRTFEVEKEMLDPAKPLLVSGVDPISKMVRFRVGIGIPYFISAPIVIHGEVDAILVTGRLVEEWPYLLPLNTGDMETVHTVCTYLSAIMTVKNLAASSGS